ncbi:hypothetical protein HOC01_06160 [archaeon]|jgi:4-amino-4-deoxy-L-arabinose transferase-like glycosyltransferase|nr:hypothetical protein [archaeon]MBT6697573.1 hypothetical protein [archaeon]
MEKNHPKKKSRLSQITWIFIIILTLSFALKVGFGLDNAIYDDESNYAFAAANAYSIGFSPSHYSGILAQWFYSPLVKIFGVHVFLLRLIPLLFSTGSIILTYLLARKIYNEKTALFASLIMITSFWHNLASIQIDVEGSILTFFYLTAIWAYLNLHNKLSKEEENPLNTNKPLTLFGINLSLKSLFAPTFPKLKEILTAKHLLLALALTIIPQVKNNGIFIFPILLLTSIYFTKSLSKSIKELTIPFTLAILGQFLITGFSYILDPDYVGLLLHHGGSRVAPGISILAIMMILFWATPYLLTFLGLATLNKKIRQQKESALFIIWAMLILIFVIFFVSRGDYSRYAMNIIPAIAILGGAYLANFKWKKIHAIFLAITTITYLLFTFVINTLPKEMTPRVMEEYVQNILSGNFFFLFSYTSPSGPIFGITMASFIITLVLTILLLIYLYTAHKKSTIQTFKYVLLTIIAINLAFNIFLISELLVSPTNPNISDTLHEMQEYVESNNLLAPFASNNAGTLFMLDNQNEISDNVIEIPDFELDASPQEFKEIINQNGATAIILNWPPLPSYSPLWESIEDCQKLKTFKSRNYETGYIYSC